MAYNNRVHSSSRETPTYLAFGHDLSFPQDIMLREPEMNYNEAKDYTQEVAERLPAIYIMAQRHLGETFEKNKIRRDKIARDLNFKVGDLVWLYSPALKLGHKRKLSKLNSGPFRVIEVINNVNYKIARVDRPSKQQIVHVDRLSVYKERKQFREFGVKGDQNSYKNKPHRLVEHMIEGDCLGDSESSSYCGEEGAVRDNEGEGSDFSSRPMSARSDHEGSVNQEEGAHRFECESIEGRRYNLQSYGPISESSK